MAAAPGTDRAKEPPVALSLRLTGVMAGSTSRRAPRRRMATPVVLSVGMGPGHEPHNTDPERGLFKEEAPKRRPRSRLYQLHTRTRASTTFRMRWPPSPTTRPVRRRAGTNRTCGRTYLGELARRPILTRRRESRSPTGHGRTLLVATDEAVGLAATRATYASIEGPSCSTVTPHPTPTVTGSLCPGDQLGELLRLNG